VSGRFALGPEVKRSAVAGGAMLYDTSRAGNLSEEWFEPRFWQARGELDGSARGRGATYFIRADQRRFVLRHYRRGGLMARLFGDHYRWRDEQSTRPFAEWQLTYRLPTVGSLAECLRTGALSVVTWIAIGRCIRRFHDFGVCHADLNAHNVLLSEEGVYLIDFDRCLLRKPGLWCDGNLVRLRRSLEKVSWGMPPERFSESDWHGLLDGYRQSSGRTELPP
jgi:3-deoxy-D-manno-octulosonic acid kinase